jgi:ATP-dependent helicase/nuclease subunit A
MTLADQADRDRIEQRLDQTLFVEAGAGTGKTHQLVQRIANLIARGAVQANEIAAITFTEKAAAELYDRVLEELDQRRAAETDPVRQRLFANAAEQLDYAAIETLHAFAGRILRLHPIEAGLPPGFQILDESQASLKFAERWEAALDELLEHDDLAEPLLVAFDAGIELADFESVAIALHQDWDRTEQDNAEMQTVEVDAESFIKDLRDVLEERHRCIDDTDKLYQRLVELQPFLERLEAASDDPGKLVRLLRHTTPTSLRASRTGRKSSWPGDAHLPIRETLSRLNEEREVLRSRIILSCCAPVFNELRRIIVQYADERRRSGELEFQDLLVRASRLLESDGTVPAAVRRRFKRLLIDEFQDNDPLQTRIIDAITQGEPGRAFFVGDPKQSIYRFRRADIQQFNQVKQGHQDGLTRLTQNFRSAPGVTEFVNAVFRPLMTAGGPDQAEWEDLHAGRDAMERVEQAVTIVGNEYEGPIGATRALEANTLARMIADITASCWQVDDKAQSACRDARYADTAVLTPTRTGLAQLLPALEERDIPYRLESRSLVYNTREIRDLLSLLQSLDDPTDQIALVAALRSPAFACADDDLYRWRQARGSWDYRQPRPQSVPEDDPVADSMLWLNEFASRRWEMSVSELVGHTIRERRLMELAVAERQPREHWNRYRFLLDQARAFCDGGGATLSEFLAWAKHQAENDTQVIESVVPEEDHDAVRIMTVHAAKGLEFPIVVFAGLNSPPRISPPALLWDSQGRPQIRLRGNLQTPGFAELWEREQQLQQQEYVRRNYVGATRARDHLIVSLYRKAKQKCDAHLIAEVVERVNAPCRWLPQDRIPDPPLIPRMTDSTSETDTQDDRQRWLDERALAVQRLQAVPRESATGIAKLASTDAQEPGANPNYEPAEDLPPWRRGRAGTAIGRATHGVLQVIDLEEPSDTEVTRAVEAQAAAESLNRQATAEVGRLVQRAMVSDTVREALAGRRYWRELYAAVEIDGVLLDGFIDLLYELPNGNLVVVDYKTDALRPGEAVDAAVERYRLQAASYALILEQSLGRTVERCVLLFLEPNEERVIPELPQAIAEVRTALAQVQV